MSKILIATNNAGKQREIQALLEDLGERLVMPAELGLRLDVTESGGTYAENASLKARSFAALSGLPSLADDSGLEVDALDGRPGLRSARFAPWPAATDSDRRHLLLEHLQVYPRPWTARFRCVVALVLPDGTLHLAEGVCPGEIIPEERGNNGFGYDPIFLVSGSKRTMAELTMEEKNRLSHRARAVLAIRPRLLEIPWSK